MLFILKQLWCDSAVMKLTENRHKYVRTVVSDYLTLSTFHTILHNPHGLIRTYFQMTDGLRWSETTSRTLGQCRKMMFCAIMRISALLLLWSFPVFSALVIQKRGMPWDWLFLLTILPCDVICDHLSVLFSVVRWNKKKMKVINSTSTTHDKFLFFY